MPPPIWPTSARIFSLVLLAGPRVQTIFVRLTRPLYLASMAQPNYRWRYRGGSQRLSLDLKPKRSTIVA